LDISLGDTLLVGSDLLRFIVTAKKWNRDFTIDRLINLFLEKIGKTGTLLIPTYNWDFCRGIEFNINTNRPQTGSLGIAALKRSDFERTKHPIYSFAVSGDQKEYYTSLNNKSAFGEGSPFEVMYKNKARMLLIDLPLQRSFTFVHYVEEKMNVPYRFLKEFYGDYINAKGERRKNACYAMFVRKLDEGVVTTLDELETRLLEKNKMKQEFIGNISFLFLKLRDAHEIIKHDIITNGGNRLHKRGKN